MTNKEQGCLSNPGVTNEEIRRAWQGGVVEAAERHRAANVPMVIWDYDKQEVVELSAEEFLQLAQREPADSIPS